MIKSIITENPKTSHKLFNTRQAENVGSISSLYSDTTKMSVTKLEKQQNENMFLNVLQELLMLKF